MSDHLELHKNSWILYHVLDRTMGNREMVAVRRKLAVLEEQLDNVTDTSVKRFATGSSAEGVDMQGSDTDLMLVDNSVVVLSSDHDTRITPHIPDKSVLIMRDAKSRPGYVTLELVNMEQNFPEYLIEFIVPVGGLQFLSSEMLTRFHSDRLSVILDTDMGTHGPASTASYEGTNIGIDVDFVHAFPCSSWPREANEWVSRPRLHNWPDKCLRYQIVQGGCHLVPVGDKTSTDTFLQWRISFVTAERKLIHSLNHVQFLVYCLLKYLLKQISGRLKTIYGDTDILSSYIIKTCLFYAVENTPRSLWQEKNTFLCFMLCLNILTTWVKAGYCPNYFIYRNNMFLGKVHGDNQQKLLRLLVQLHDMTWGCLSIGTFFKPTIGEYISRVRNGEWGIVMPTPARSESECDLKIFSESFSSTLHADVLPFVLELLYKSRSDKDEFIAYVCTLRALSFQGMETFEKHVHPTGNKENYKSLKKCKTFITPLASTCLSPGLLTLATYHYQTGNYRKTLEMCGHVISSRKILVGGMDNVVNHLERYEHFYCGRGYSLLQKCQQIYVSDIEFTKMSSHFCPSQLNKELTKLTVAGHLCVPPLSYAMFLTFLCYHELNDTRRRDEALIHLRAVKYDEYQGGSQYWIVHNLLGICYEMVGDIPRALREYKDSLGGKRAAQYLNAAWERIGRQEQSE